MESTQKIAFIFDFDNSLVDSDTDKVILEMDDRVSQEGYALMHTMEFNALRNHVVRLLHEYGYTKKDFENRIKS